MKLKVQTVDLPGISYFLVPYIPTTKKQLLGVFSFIKLR